MPLTHVRSITRSVSAWRWEGDEFDARPRVIKTIKVVLTAAMSDVRQKIIRINKGVKNKQG